MDIYLCFFSALDDYHGISKVILLFEEYKESQFVDRTTYEVLIINFYDFIDRHAMYDSISIERRDKLLFFSCKFTKL